MELIEYLNPLSSNTDSITRISIFSILIVFAISVIYLAISFYSFKRFFKKGPSEILNSKRLASLIFEFETSLIEFQGVKKSTSSLVKKVPRSALLNVFFNEKILNSVGNTLVGLGILGTFLGLSKGVSGFQMESTETIKTSIESLLGGMGTAFISSIYGMLASISYLVIYQFTRHGVAKQTDRFYAEVDRVFLMSELELETFDQIRLENSIRKVVEEYFVGEEDGKILTPKFYFRELLNNSRNQTSSLSSLSDDLAGVLEDIIDKMLEINSEKFKEIIESQLVPILEQLRKEKEESASGALEGVLTKLEMAMKDMLEEFKESISGETKNELNNLAQSLDSITKALGSMPNDISNLSGDMTRNMTELIESIKATIIELNERQNESDRLRNQNQEAATNKLNSILNNVSTNVEGLLSQQVSNSNKMMELLETVDEVISRNNESIHLFREIIQNSKKSINEINEASDLLSVASKDLNESAKSVSYNNKLITDSIQDYIKANDEGINKLQSLQNEVAKKTSDFLSDFSQMESGIEKVFIRFNSGLEAYTNELSSELSKVIGNYSEKSANAINTLHALIEELNDLLGGLNEKLDD